MDWAYAYFTDVGSKSEVPLNASREQFGLTQAIAWFYQSGALKPDRTTQLGCDPRWSRSSPIRVKDSSARLRGRGVIPLQGLCYKPIAVALRPTPRFDP